MPKKLIFTLIGIGLIAAGALAFTLPVKANDSNGQQTMVERFSEKLGIDENKIDSAMSEIRAENQKEMQAKKEEKLNQAVKDGVITEAQKSAIEVKMTEMQQKREQERTQMQQWLKDNNLDTDKLHDYGLGMGFGGKGGDRGFGPMM